MCRRRERGQGSLELVGIIVLAAILVAATTGTVLQASPQIRSEVSYRICQIVTVATGGECEEPGDSTEADDPRLPDEPCVVNSMQGTVEVTGSFVVTVSAGKQLVIEELSDGTYRVTEADLGGVGIGVGPGIDVSITLDGKKYGAVAIASARAMLAGKQGNTWYVDGEDGLNDLLTNMAIDNVKDQIVPEHIGPSLPGGWGIPNPNRWLVDELTGSVPEPDETFYEGGIEGDAAASASSITHGAGGSVNVSGYLGGKQTPDGYVAYYSTSVSGDVFATAAHLDASAGASGELLFEVNMGQDGQVESVTINSSYTLAAEAGTAFDNGDDQTHVETSATVPLTGDPAYDAEILAAVSGNPLAIANFMQHAAEDGQITRNTSSVDPNTYGLNVGGSLIGKVGGSGSFDYTTQDLQEAEYWNGEEFVPRPDCGTE